MISLLIHSAVCLVALGGVYGALERSFPARAQALFRPAWGTDALFFFGQYLLWSLCSLKVLGLTQGALASLPRLSQPLWLAGLEVVVAGDVLVYWFHRACHRYEFLWR